MTSPKLTELDKKRIKEEVKELKKKEVKPIKEKVCKTIKLKDDFRIAQEEDRVDKFIRTCGQPTKYDEKIHIKLLFDLFEKGETIASFCATAFISRQTFYIWLSKHELFKKAFEVALQISQSIWEKMPQIYPEMNFNYWRMMMMNMFNVGKLQIDLTEYNSAKSRMEGILKGLACGILSGHEANQLANLIMAETNIKVTEQIGVNPNMILSNEALRERVALLDKMIEHEEQKGSNEQATN